MNAIIPNTTEANIQELKPQELPPRPKTTAILMCSCEHFDVIDIKNPFMAKAIDTSRSSGSTEVDRERAGEQWQKLKASIEKSGKPVLVLDGKAGLEDMVFSANQVFVGYDQRIGPYVVPALMKHESRRREVPHYLRWFEEHGYGIRELNQIANEETCFEGHGDAIWHPGRELIWGGFGQRTTLSAYKHLGQVTNCVIALLEMIDTTFYHLDTAFCPLDERTVLYYPEAFSEDSIRLIESGFEKSIKVCEEDALNFACNALVVENTVLLQKGSDRTRQALIDLNFEAIEVDTSEFMKSGGSAFCLTTDIYH